MPDTPGQISQIFKTTCGLGCAGCEILIVLVGLWQVIYLQNAWFHTVPMYADVLTGQMEGYWGPVHVVVPQNCSSFQSFGAVQPAGASNQKKARLLSLADTLEVKAPFVQPVEQVVSLEDSRLAGPPAEAEDDTSAGTSFLPSRRLDGEPPPVDPASLEVTSNASYVVVRRCGRTVTLKQPTTGQWFWSMLWLSGADDAEELRNSRWRMLLLLAFLAVVDNIFNWAARIASDWGLRLLFLEITGGPREPLVDPDGYKYEPLTQPVGAKLDGADSVVAKVGFCTAQQIVKVISKYITVQSQLALLSLFFIYWEDSYYVMSYIPGKAYICVFGFWVVVSGLLCLFLMCDADTCCLTFWGIAFLLYILACIFLIFAFCGYGVFQAQFLMNTAMADVANHQDTKLVDSQWLGSEYWLKWIMRVLFGMHVAEFLTITYFDVLVLYHM